ncbi:MAG TPA: putative Ig domain-containing protein [Steroidobacteraceae bacterium]|nr:putative Ig domain-containing protein [Steroidobacteraceae bacterium]
MPVAHRTRAPWRRALRSILVIAGLGAASAALATTVTISGTPASTVSAGSAYSFTPSATDSSGKKPSYSITGKPSWASFNSSTGALTGTPSSANVGKYGSIGISAYDGSASSAVLWFSITVQASSSGTPTTGGGSGPLKISGSPASTVAAGKAYAFTPTTTDSSGKKISFSVTGKPSWASFSSATGALTGTPAAANVGKYSSIGIEAYDGSTTAMLWFSITVTATSSSASTITLSGTPSTSATVGKAYSFQPTAKDSAGKTVSFSVSNKPSWATFSISSGLLSGTPTSTQTDSSITISASDGTASSALPAFSIAVGSAAATTGSATVAWVDPTQNTNGTALTNLAGVHIYYGQSEGSLTNEITVASPTQTTYTVGGLSSGTWYFAATAYTSSGSVSALSQIGSKTIQ